MDRCYDKALLLYETFDFDSDIFDLIEADLASKASILSLFFSD
jgi:hypothetical protein